MKLSELFESWANEDDGDTGGSVAVALHREYIDVEVAGYFVVVGEPQSKSRARVSMRGDKPVMYTPKQTELAEENIADAYRDADGAAPNDEATYGVFAAFFCGTRQRRDVDNMLKLILDGLNKVAWVDDSQVTEVSARLVRGGPKDQARTEVIIYRTMTEMTGGLKVTKPCGVCHRPIRVYDSTNHRQFCSPLCAGRAKRIRPPITCQRCRCEFQGAAGRRYCSRACESAATNVPVRCARCSAVFRAKKAFKRIYCSKACADIAKIGKPRIGIRRPSPDQGTLL